jgi:uncharacterized membrane protein
MTRSGILRITILALLVVSLAGNFFAIGYIVHGWRSGPGMLSTVLEARYPPDVRRAFRDVLRDNRDNVRAALAELRTTRDAQETLARGRPVDEAAMRAEMARVRAATTHLQSQLQDYLIVAIKRAGDQKSD